MEQRRKRVLKKYAVIFALGLLYLAWVLLTDWRIPCVFNLIFKLKCPGCGITRMIAAVARLDFRAAFLFNPFIFTTLPIILFIIIYSEISYVRYGAYYLGKINFLIWAELVAALLFGIFRNF